MYLISLNQDWGPKFGKEKKKSVYDEILLTLKSSTEKGHLYHDKLNKNLTSFLYTDLLEIIKVKTFQFHTSETEENKDSLISSITIHLWLVLEFKSILKAI